MAIQNDYAVMAAATVERLFPPLTVEDVHRVVSALNLLNAVVKLPHGRELTSYNYIKGMVACVFVWLLYHPQEGVELDWDEQENVTYICVSGIQYSFHHVPLVHAYVRQKRGWGLTPQQWDGEQRQLIAGELFDQAMEGCLPQVGEGEGRKLIAMMRHYNNRKVIRRINGLDGVETIIREAPVEQEQSAGQKTVGPTAAQQGRRRRLKHLKKFRIFVERHLPHPHHPLMAYGGWKQQALQWKGTERQYLYDLTLALKFNGWWEEDFELSRNGERHVQRVVCYTGSNYSHLIGALVSGRPLRYIRPERRMRKGWRYFLRRSNWSWAHMTYTRYLLLVAHYNNLTVDGECKNLCITYGLARYLAKAYPQLRFINVLNFTRFKVHRRVYTYRDLQRVPLHSKSRVLKVWMVVDPLLLLGDLDVESLPEELLAEYRAVPDYCEFFQKVQHHGKVGLVAYSRFHLLPTVYQCLYVSGHYVRVMNDERKWAVYSLMEEAFETDFIYDRIYNDPYLYMVVGCVNGEKVILHDMLNPT